jgi:hypothetical protein
LLKCILITVLASKDHSSIPAADLAIVCNDLSQAIYLGEDSKMIREAVAEYCQASPAKQ